jgi:transcriptional regulator with XRE-family HTH domain
MDRFSRNRQSPDGFRRHLQGIAFLIYCEMDMDASALGLRLARLRRQAGLTQAELARRMGTTQPAISKIESGRTFPTIPLLDRFAQATGTVVELKLGAEEGVVISRDERARRSRAALRGYRFNPWDRSPTDAEARSLIADGLTPERFQREEPARTGSS